LAGKGVSPFNENRYKELLEGLEVSEVRLLEIMKFSLLRLEAEFYNAKSFNLKNPLTGSEIIDFVQYGTSKELNENNIGYPILRLNEFESSFISEPRKYCSIIDNATFNSLKLLKNDVLVCRTNGNAKYVGKSAIVPKNYEFAYASYLFKIRPKRSLINSSTLVTYLNSKYGRIEIEKYSMASNQVNFSPAKFRQLRIPRFSSDFNSKIEGNTYDAFNLLTLSKQKYANAEQLLLQELGLDNFKPTTQNINTLSFSQSFGSSGRLDAEYYQPKYEQIEERLTVFEQMRIDDLFKVLSNSSPKKYIDSGIKVIKTKNVRIPTPVIDSIRDFTEITENPLQANDLLFASMGVGSLGRVSILLDIEQELTTDGTIKILRTKEQHKGLNHEIPTMLFLTSHIGQEIIYKHVIGSTGIISIRKPDVMKILIPIASAGIREKLSALVVESIRLKKQSQQLLQVAKQAVEIAIEQSEAAAMAFIERETNM